VPIYVAREGLDVPLVLEPMKDGPDLVRFDEARWLDNGGR
jgi:hypothetical protein